MMDVKQRAFVRIDYEPRTDYFSVQIRSDDSMINAGVHIGAIVIFRKQRYAENGNIILAQHNGMQVLRYYKTDGENIYLMPANNTCLPIVVKKTDDFLILGKAVEIRIEV